LQTMKTSLKTIAWLSTILGAAAFAPQVKFCPSTESIVDKVSRRYMFTGSGQGLPIEDDEEKLAEMEKQAKSMGMTLEEFQLGNQARVKMEQEITNIRAKGGDESKGITVEKDGLSPPKHLVIKITDVGKALGKDAFEKELVAAFKTASEASEKARNEANKNMMVYISEELKKRGVS